jgi:pimeloyl-ACP methyl ester carboxylesterase
VVPSGIDDSPGKTQAVGEWVYLDNGGVRLPCRDYCGNGPAILLLHGLAGHAGEWRDTASFLVPDYHVVALDGRGHGRSERHPDDVSPEASVADVALVIQRLQLAPVVLVGQSLGGLTAFLVAARHPELVRALVLVDAGPADEPDGDDWIEHVADRLRRWPVPFQSREAALTFFGGPSLAADAWARGLEHRKGGLWPRFDIDVLVSILRAAPGRSYLDDWKQIRCPTLIVRPERGMSTRDEGTAMTAALPHAEVAEIDGAEHDVHLDRPQEWRATLRAFLRDVTATSH